MTLLRQGRSGSALLDQLTAEAVERKRKWTPPEPIAPSSVSARIILEPVMKAIVPVIAPKDVKPKKYLRGIFRCRKRWVARVRSKDNEVIYRASFDTEQEAYLAYCAVKDDLFRKGEQRCPAQPKQKIIKRHRPSPKWHLPPRLKSHGPIKIADIQRAVSSHFGISSSDIVGGCRKMPLTRHRQTAMYLCHILTRRSLPEIGRMFGRRDHTTILHAIRKIVDLIEGTKASRYGNRQQAQHNTTLAEDIAALKAILVK